VRPTPSEVVDGVTRTLRETIAPVIGDGHARNQLDQIIGVLRALDPEDAAFRLYTRHAEFCRLIDECREWIDGDPTRGAHFTPIPSVSDGPATSFADINDRHESARAVLSDFIGELATWRRRDDPAQSDQLVERVGRVLAGRRARR